MSELTIAQNEMGFFSRRAGLLTALGLGLIVLPGAFLRLYQLALSVLAIRITLPRSSLC
jgi:hypothetical protein